MFFKKVKINTEDESKEREVYDEFVAVLKERGFDNVIIMASGKGKGGVQALVNGNTKLLGKMVSAFLDDQKDIMRAMVVDKMKSLGKDLSKLVEESDCGDADCPVHGKDNDE